VLARSTAYNIDGGGASLEELFLPVMRTVGAGEESCSDSGSCTVRHLQNSCAGELSAPMPMCTTCLVGEEEQAVGTKVCAWPW